MLANCPECGSPISTRAWFCPICGLPIRTTLWKIRGKLLVANTKNKIHEWNERRIEAVNQEKEKQEKEQREWQERTKQHQKRMENVVSQKQEEEEQRVWPFLLILSLLQNEILEP